VQNNIIRKSELTLQVKELQLTVEFNQRLMQFGVGWIGNERC
jgi:hypothetical protein